ncbi:survival motor neuron protein-like [Petromyzon marinus]|uniref:survival motor neuron protein-like n=1 Tax=Petromyzon marinus TaxID=7757 RepID=UPI003F71986D
MSPSDKVCQQRLLHWHASARRGESLPVSVPTSRVPLEAGDLCQAAWSEDGVVYDATIKSVDASAGTCVMVFTGYGNEDELKLADLLPPAAESAARASGESDAAASCDADAASRAGKR